MPYDDFQSLLSVLTEISPALETFGWNIFAANQPVNVISAQLDDTHKRRSYILVVQQEILL